MSESDVVTRVRREKLRVGAVTGLIGLAVLALAIVFQILSAHFAGIAIIATPFYAFGALLILAGLVLLLTASPQKSDVQKLRNNAAVARAAGDSAKAERLERDSNILEDALERNR